MLVHRQRGDGQDEHPPISDEPAFSANKPREKVVLTGGLIKCKEIEVLSGRREYRGEKTPGIKNQDWRCLNL